MKRQEILNTYFPAKTRRDHIEARTAVTALTIGKIFFAEGAAVIMTSPAANRTARRKMLDGDRHGDLLCLRRTGSDRVTIIAVYALPESVIGMRKNGFENRSRCLRPAIRRDFVTDIARTDIAFGRVTGIASCVRFDTDRNCLRRAVWLMTRRTTRLRSARAARMRRVIEFHIKAFVKLRRK